MRNATGDASDRWLRGARAGAALSAALAALVMAPIVGAGFHPEDSGWLALARQSASPWPLLTHNIDFVYFYRPLPLLLWWLSAHAFGANPVWHNALDVLLHALNAALVCLLAARVAGRAGAGVLAGILFASLPVGAGTAACMSDRFDPVALGFALAALLAFESALERRRSPLWTGLWLLCAVLSKEVAYAAAVVMLLRLAALWWQKREASPGLFVVVLLAPALGVALRILSGTSVGLSLEIEDPLHAFFAGISGWWRQAPAALGGFMPATGLALLIGLLLVAVCYGLARNAIATRGARALALTGAGLLLLPAALQWPVTAPVLSDDGSRAFTENLRFYYAAAAGLALLLAAGYASVQSQRVRPAILAGCLFAAGYGGVLSYQLSARWAGQWRPSSDAYLALAADLGQRQFPAGCRIFLDAPDWTDAFRHHVDTIVKAAAPTTASVQSCAIFAGAQVYQTFLPADLCTPVQWPGLTFSERQGTPIAASVGDVCVLQFATYTAPAQLGAPLFRFRVDSDGNAQEIGN